MPTLPWVQRETVVPGATYAAMASRLPLKRFRSIPGFLRDTLAIRHQLSGTEGLVGYALDAEVVKGEFWTFSVWKTREHLDAFARSEPHHRIIERLRPFMGKTRFEFFEVSSDKLPMTWEERKAPLR
jgi:heme-degrading monooxygenase HmoA